MFVGPEMLLEYNSKGFVTKIYSDNNNTRSKPLIETDLMFYDDTDTIPKQYVTLNEQKDTLRISNFTWKSERELWQTDPAEIHLQKHTYKFYFDSLGRVSKREDVSEYDGSSTTHFYTYYSNGLLQSDRYRYQEAGAAIDTTDDEVYSYVYDSLGQLIFEKKLEGEFLVYTTTYSYEDNVRKEETKNFRGGRISESLKVEHLNKQGDVVRYNYKGHSKPSPETTYRYWYDSYGNWIKRYTYSNGIIRSVDYRKFYYY